MDLLLIWIVVGFVDSAVGRGFSKEISCNNNQQQENDVSQNGVNVPQVKALGCYRNHRYVKSLRHRYMTVDSGKIPKQITKECSKGAVARGYVYFGVQNGNECWGDKEGYLRYDMYGIAKDCHNGVGSNWSSFVYQITKVDGYCVAHSKLYRYNSFVDDVPCQACKCHTDGILICQRRQCPSLPQNCERIFTPPGKCCPVCDCIFKGMLHNEGAKWWWPINDRGCEQCTCTNGQAVCTMKVCPVCSAYVSKPGQCCRACAPKPGQIITFTIKPTRGLILTLPTPPAHFGDW